LKKPALLAIFLAVSGVLFAQTADELDTILTTREITYLQAARFILTASGSLPDGGDAFVTARENRWLPVRAKADSPVSADDSISLGEVSLLIMKSFGLKGGLLYTLFSSPRHACRELAYVRIIQGRTDPGGRLNGGEFLQILGRTLAYTGEDEALAAEEERQRLMEDVSGSLRDDAKKSRGLSSGAEDLQQYEGEFQLD
jgi:hypothetical protein